MRFALILIRCECGAKNEVVLSDNTKGQPICGRCKKNLFEFRAIMGYVYVLSNPTMRGLLKIGCTTRRLSARVKELSAASGVPKPFVVEGHSFSSDPPGDERKLHRLLRQYRAPGKEFFETSRKAALDAMAQVFGRPPDYDRRKHGELIDA